MTERVLVTGGTGFVGSHLVAALSSLGHDVVVLTRRRERARHLLPLPTVRVVEGDPYEATTLGRYLRDSTAAINLVGILHERGRETFDRAHVELPRVLCAACRNSGVRRILHMSAQNAGVDASSRYLRTKASGEDVVAQSGLAWTLFRPSLIFGRGDGFLNLFAALARWLPVIPLAGASTRFQPIFVGDVADCFARALVDDSTIEKRYGLCGPTIYTLAELVRYAADVSGHPRPIAALGPQLADLQARVMERLPGSLLTRDNLASMQRDSVCEGTVAETFGIAPVALEAVAPDYLAAHSQTSRFDLFRAHGGR
jgi:Predicted nucleoside-diphosphate-sugar epimerases